MKLHVFSADKNKFLSTLTSEKKKKGGILDQTIHNFGYL